MASCPITAATAPLLSRPPGSHTLELPLLSQDPSSSPLRPAPRHSPPVVEARGKAGLFLIRTVPVVSPQRPLRVTVQAEPARGHAHHRWAGRGARGLALDGQPPDLHVPQQSAVPRVRGHLAELPLAAHCCSLLPEQKVCVGTRRGGLQKALLRTGRSPRVCVLGKPEEALGPVVTRLRG